MSNLGEIIDVYCPNCGYNLRGIDSGRCPECGEAFDRAMLSRSELPWARRREIGWFKAYWKTVIAATTFNHKTFLDQAAGLVNLRDARRFWCITVGLAFLPVMFLGVGVQASEPQFPLFGTVIALISILLFLIVSSGAPSYLCHPARLPTSEQNRSIAISYYGCAPLAWTPLVVVVCVVLVFVAQSLRSFNGQVLMVIPIAGLVIGLPVAWFFDTARLIRHTTRGSPFIYFKLAGIWFCSAVLFLIVLPILLAFFYLFVLSYFHLV